MQITLTDERSRITIGKKLEKRYGRKFIIVPANNEIILIPVLDKDPIEGLAELGKKAGLDKLSLKQIKKIIEEEAIKEAFSNIH